MSVKNLVMYRLVKRLFLPNITPNGNLWEKPMYYVAVSKKTFGKIANLFAFFSGYTLRFYLSGIST